MENSVKKKNIMVIVFEIAVITLGIVGITFATSKIVNDRTSTIIETGDYKIDYKGEKNIEIGNLEPISDSLININTIDKVIRVEFSVKGADNKTDGLIYDVMLNNMNIDCSLLNKYTKWNLYKNGELLTQGSLDPSFDGDVLSDKMYLTTSQQSLNKRSDNYDDYVLIFWISESCDDLENCELIDQSSILNSKLSMNVFIAVYSGNLTIHKRVPNLDNTCANSPVLYNNMAPVTYKEGKWVVADVKNSNSDYLWYDYQKGIWANSVVVSKNKYSNIGTELEEDDIVSWYVWIPRYRYKLWNIGENVTDSYNAYDNGIDILFENGLNSSNQEIANDNYVTHPAFGNNLKGFWINKYEISKDSSLYKSIPNIEVYTSDTLDNYKTITSNLANDYLLGNNANTMMIGSDKWGATLYLSHSKYGVCKNNGCDLISTNNTYKAGSDKQDTTTRNVYGVYDMAGSASEYVLSGNEAYGSATNEVKLADGNTWYNGMGMLSTRDYILRGGINRGLFYFGDISMSETKYGTRSVLINK